MLGLSKVEGRLQDGRAVLEEVGNVGPPALRLVRSKRKRTAKVKEEKKRKKRKKKQLRTSVSIAGLAR
jgi:hypothetical protein